MTNRFAALCGSASITVALLSTGVVGFDSPTKGTVDVITVHGTSLEGNLAGDSPDRRVSVYLPPSYATAKARRYPVVYLLHIAIDAGNADEPIATTVRTMHGMLDVYGVAHTFEIYEGNHVDHIGERMTNHTLPFFVKNLAFPGSASR